MSDERLGIEQLLNVMARLRDPKSGCPWDLEQDFSTIAPYTIEEAYEVADAIERNDMSDLREELGDLLLQVVFHSQIAEEKGLFSFDTVARAISAKMVDRHPHVFGDGRIADADAQTRAWEAMKAKERASKSSGTISALDGVALGLPALLRALKLQKRAARTGFDWKTVEPIFEKLDEEIAEVKEAISAGNATAIEDEIGDLLFVVANLARRLDVDPEQALRRANGKFERRFRAMEALSLSRQSDFNTLDLEAQDGLWNEVKLNEKAGT